ncbi:MAG: ATPase, T2SS/T4P/T4SS family [Myxococcota bacterium]
MAHKRLGEMLVEAGTLTEEKVELALNVQKRTSERFGVIIQRLGFITQNQLGQAVAKQYGLAFVDLRQLREVEIDLEALEKMSEDFARQHTMVPVNRRNRKYLVVADILNTVANDRAQTLIGRCPMVLSTETAIATILETYAFGGKDGERIVESARDAISKGELNELLGWLMGRAVLGGASDIHIEPVGPVSVVRFRVDGVLQPEISLPRERHENLVNVLFGKSGIDLSDFHRLRDGRFSFKFAGRTLDVRFASSPTVEGPMVVMRILDDTRSLTVLKDLGFTQHNLTAIAALIRNPFGVIPIVGPTGSGKTTTLYSILSSLNDTQKKILTVEDPVEIRLPSVQQVQVNEKAGVTFANCVRGFMRQDPDIILVGEIRDEETARETYRAANTGHLVLTTVHANTAVEAVARLVDLGLESFRVADGSIGVVAQRLLRQVCPRCSVPTPYQGMPDARSLGPGCGNCSKGFIGRCVVAEVLTFDDELRTLVHLNKPASELEGCARRHGFQGMIDNGRQLVAQGLTTAAEVERVLGPLDVVPMQAAASGSG